MQPLRAPPLDAMVAIWRGVESSLAVVPGPP